MRRLGNSRSLWAAFVDLETGAEPGIRSTPLRRGYAVGDGEQLRRACVLECACALALSEGSGGGGTLEPPARFLPKRRSSLSITHIFLGRRKSWYAL